MIDPSTYGVVDLLTFVKILTTVTSVDVRIKPSCKLTLMYNKSLLFPAEHLVMDSSHCFSCDVPLSTHGVIDLLVFVKIPPIITTVNVYLTIKLTHKLDLF